MEVDTIVNESTAEEIIIDVVSDGIDHHIDTPKASFISADSTFVAVERLLKVDHGVDYDTKEKNPIISVSINPLDTRVIATGGMEGSVRIWQVISFSTIDAMKLDDSVPTQVSQVTTLLGHTGQVNGVRFSPDGRYLASGSSDGTVRVFSTQGWKLAHSLRFHTLDVTDVEWFSANVLISTSTDRNTVVWDAQTGGRLQTLYSDKGSCPKGLSVDPKGEFLAVLFDEGLVDIYRRNIDGKFRLSRHVSLSKDDAPNYARAFKTTLYARRASWTSDGKHILFPLGSRGKYGPCGVEYDRFNLLDPTPGESLCARKVFAGHASRVVVVSTKPGLVSNPKISEDPFSVSALISVDGVVSVWASTRQQPIGVIANITGPLRVCTDASWGGDVLFLSASDGSVTTVSFKNLGKVVNTVEIVPMTTNANISQNNDVKSAQFELRVGGKRKIQPVVADQAPALVQAPVATQIPRTVIHQHLNVENKDSNYIVKTSPDGIEVMTGSGSVTCLTKVGDLVVLGCVDGDGLGSILPQNGPRIILPGAPRLMMSEATYLAFLVGSSSVCVWKLAQDGAMEAVWDDVSVEGLFASQDGIEALKVDDYGTPSLKLKSGKCIDFNPRLRRWIVTN